MTGVTNGSNVTKIPPSADEVAAYLGRHPEFFSRFPALLAELKLPHQHGESISLFDHQVLTLREENRQFRKQLDDLIELAKDNERLIDRIHHIALALMESAGPEAIFSTLQKYLKSDFDADEIVCLIFGDPAFIDVDAVPQFAGKAAPTRAAFDDLFAARAPQCGELTESQHLSLFPGSKPIGSNVLLPLVGNGWDGVMVINSRDESRYDPAMGTEFLTYLSDVVTLVLDPWVERDRPR